MSTSDNMTKNIVNTNSRADRLRMIQLPLALALLRLAIKGLIYRPLYYVAASTCSPTCGPARKGGTRLILQNVKLRTMRRISK